MRGFENGVYDQIFLLQYAASFKATCQSKVCILSKKINQIFIICILTIYLLLEVLKVALLLIQTFLRQVKQFNILVSMQLSLSTFG